jgi:Tfp pilus assembly protein PilF
MAYLFLLLLILIGGDSRPAPSTNDLLWHHRNLGKAFYENPMTQMKAVDEFRAALELSPKSTRDRVNYGLALLRAGKTPEAIATLTEAQKQDPTIPHTWFNLGMAYKKEFDHPRAIEQFQGMLKLVPDEPVTHYNLGIEYKLTGKSDLALPEFTVAAKLNPNFAAPHFQLYNAYRELGRKEDAAKELESFNEIKKRKAGAAMAEDPEWSFYAEIYDVIDSEEVENEAPAFKFTAKKVASGIDPQTAGMVVLDFDGDGRPDLLTWSKNGVVLLKNGSVPQQNTGLEELKDVVSITPGDFNNDGLPDLAVITTSGVKLYVNSNGKFQPYAAALPNGTFTKAIWIDFDHDYDLDLILLGSRPVLLRNEGAKGFSDQTSRFPFAQGKAIDAAEFDLVPDNTETDLTVLYEDGSVVVYRDKLLGHFEAQPLAERINGGKSLQALDINNDGWTDLAVMTATGVRWLMNQHGKLVAQDGPAESGPLVFADLANRGLTDLVAGGAVYQNAGQGKFKKTDAGLPTVITLAQADFDGDGRADLALVAQDGSVELLKNETVTSNNFLGVRLEGVKNVKLAAGAVVEVKTGAWYQKKIYEGVPLLFGIRSYTEADTLRITWPNGLVQNEIKEAAGKEFSYKEKPRLSGSCPMIFTWNGSHFQFITDVLGVAPLGASNGDGQFFPVNHREYIQIPPQALQQKDGRAEIRITEELREVSYLDKIQLIAVDHRAGEELVTNDKFKAPPFPQFRLYGVEHKIYPRSARDEQGADLLDKISSDDGLYAAGFHCGSAGVAGLHELVLDFDKAAPDGRAVLVLNGWVDWADGSTFAGAAQESDGGLIFPYLQVKDGGGKWQTVVPDMGMPSGKPKAIAVDLTGKFLSSSREIKIVTNLCVYWDEIFLSEKTVTPKVTMTSVTMESADLHYRGFSTVTLHPGEAIPEEFDYDRWSPTTMWNPTPGLYTRYGDVRSLLQRADDEMVIMGSGDELRLCFDVRSLPRLPKGWQRSYLLLVDGWAKDADANTAYARTVEPLPFHDMNSYPYPAPQHFPDDARHRNYKKTFISRPAVRDLDLLMATP